MQSTTRHQCLIYEGSPAPHSPGLTALIRQKLSENHRCLYLNSPPMIAGMRSYLYAAGVDVPKEVMKGSLIDRRTSLERELSLITAKQEHLVDAIAAGAIRTV